jgi:hypothetical protein
MTSVLQRWSALAGEGRLLDLEGGGHDEPPVRRHQVPASTSTMSPGTSSDASTSIALPSRRTRAMVFIVLRQGCQARLRLRLSPESEYGVEHRETHQDQRGRPVAGEHDVHDGGTQQDDLHEVLVLTGERLPARLPLLLRQEVGANPLEPSPDLVGGQAEGRIDPEPACGIGTRDAVDCAIRR